MTALAEALTFAVAYLGSTPRSDDNDEDNDVNALESLAALLQTATGEEREAIRSAAEKAIASIEKSSSPNTQLLQGYRSCIENFCEPVA